ncbi:AsmA2 domain-containing protein YhdP [Klebsiella sp. BIGb0407]|uniref:AsmA2 domain-containing protein YhdP n=1 Tax=Klebsiella sp. BIGb0407 TaxID=2940603 RepID=UPI00216905F1|nr:AsmA2 domain-containing protein YhdP [Klebsiella sp. BIGb0407]MCS3433196.1 uncharacterized protein (TIGR02099 family) [Klebsiella sp. BIGb0407]
MRKLPGILLLTGVGLIVIVALLVSALRLVLPHLDTWRPALLEKIEQATGVPVRASHLEASWQSFGPTLNVEDIHAPLNEGGSLSIKRVTLALDVWQSLLHARWQFRDLTFYQLQMHINTPIDAGGGGDGLEASKISDLFLRQFDHFDLRDSTFSFLTLSGQRSELSIPQLTWLNNQSRHRAEGTVSLSSFNGQHGFANVRLDLRDENGLLDSGKIWLQADDVDVKPWFSRWMTDHLSLQSARFSLEGWMDINGGEIRGGNIWLKQGGASWESEDNTEHHLSVDNLTAEISRESSGWELVIPDTNITLDESAWPKGRLELAWLNGQDKAQGDELRVRASNMELASFNGLMPIATRFSPDAVKVWKTMQPKGHVSVLALDIPLAHPDQTRMQASWNNVSWNQWQLVPGVEHLSGTLSGSVMNGKLDVLVVDGKMPYETVFRAPLEIAKGSASLLWKKDAEGFELEGKNIDVQALAVWAKGDFRYLQPTQGEPWLGILAGIKTNNGAEAWRYFPENLMGKDLTDYLSGAIQGGQSDNATLVFGGDPGLFPFKGNEGQFQVYVPLRQATYAFQPDWPALKDLDITLDFLNQGLWMSADKVALGGVTARNLTANIPDYDKEKLLIDADINGPGAAVGPYFKDTPLDDSLAAALDELQISGDVNARLHLDIPLDGEMAQATGDVTLKNNDLLIKPLESTLHRLSGKFSFANGDLRSEPLQATWFNQPVNIDFSTKTGEKDYQINVNLNGDWQPGKMDVLPDDISQKLSGRMGWTGKVDISLPYRGDAKYQVSLAGNLKNVSSHLPAPLSKSAGTALPVNIVVKGSLKEFTLSGNAGAENHFSSRWLLSKNLKLDSAIWASGSKSIPALPESNSIELYLPAIAGEQWLGLSDQNKAQATNDRIVLPQKVTLNTPMLALGGQQWHDVSLTTQPTSGGTKVVAKGRELNATLEMHKNAAWQASISYLYYNPDWAMKSDKSTDTSPSSSSTIDFRGWPSVDLRCAECWLWGQKYGRIDADLIVKGDTLQLENGLIEAGFARLTAEGEWVNKPGGIRTALKGTLTGQKVGQAASFFGVSIPLQESSFDVNYDLHWRDVPWTPDESSLSGILKMSLGRGKIESVGTGRAGQLLRLVSFDALLRKLRFDFRDTFGSGFYYDSINSTAWIKDGIFHTDDTLVDGLEADIAIKGEMDLVRRELNFEALVAPEISATVSVATAFAVNPIVGAAVFAASKVLSPLWSKVSILRYSITGPMDKPQVDEVLRQPKIGEDR